MEKDIDVHGHRLHYDESGPTTGAPIVLLHGWGCNHTTVASIRKLLEGKMHVYSFDLPGYGKPHPFRPFIRRTNFHSSVFTKQGE